jgi:hypothetical protein
LAPAPLRTHELANGNVLTAKLLAEPAGLGAVSRLTIAYSGHTPACWFVVVSRS